MSPNSQKTSICHKCGYDANPITAIRCELCKQPLELNVSTRNSVSNERTIARHHPKLSSFWVALASLLSLLVGGSFFFWRSQVSNTQSFQLLGGKENSTTMTLLGDTFSGYSTFRSAAFQKALKELQVEVRYENEFNQAQRFQLLNEGKADLLVTSLDQFLKQKPQGKIVGLIDYTVGGDAVVLNTKKYPSLKSLQDLNQLAQQKRSQNQQLDMTFAGDTPSEYLALLLDTKFEAFKLLDFQAIKVADAVDAWKQLQSNPNVALAILWEPFVTQAQQQGYAVVLSSKDTPGAIIDVIVAADRVLQSQPEKISAFLEAYYRLIDTYTGDRLLLKNQIAEDGKLSSDEAIAVLQGIDFFTAIEAKNWMSDGTLEKKMNSTAAVLTLTGRIQQAPQTARDLFTSQFLERATSNTQKLISSIRADNPELADKLAGKTGIATDSLATNSGINPNQTQTASELGVLQIKEDIEFQSSSAELTLKGKQALNRLAKKISEFNPQTMAVRVIGHTSRRGLADLNQKLSQQRAQAVINELKQRGLQHKMVAEGKGFSQLISGISPYDPRNQRTEIRLVRSN
jgi:outer membrane protein OmpA-like peptidoglycan-associated protein